MPKWKKLPGHLTKIQFFNFSDSKEKYQDGLTLPILLRLNFKSRDEMENCADKGIGFFYQRYEERFESNSEALNWSFQAEKFLFKLHN